MMNFWSAHSALLAGLLAILPVSNALAYETIVSVNISQGGGKGASVPTFIPKGLHIFALPAEPVQPLSAQKLRNEVQKSGGQIGLLAYISDQGKFSAHISGLTPDFNLQVGRGYLINNKKACTINLAVKINQPSVKVPIHRGLNMISVPMGGPYKADTLLEDLKKAGVGVQRYIIRVEGGQFRLHFPDIPALGTRDFSIARSTGYIIGSTRNFDWIPRFIPQFKSPPSSDPVKGPTPLWQKRRALLEEAAAQQITGSASNRPPIVLSPGKATVSGEDFHDKLIALDLDGDPLGFSVSPTPPGLKIINNTGDYHWDLAMANQGTYKVEFTAWDGVNSTVQPAEFHIVKGDTALLAHYALEGNSVDARGNYPGSSYGQVYGTRGVKDRALEFRGGGINLPDHYGFLRGRESFTLSMWAKYDPSRNPNGRVLFSRNDGGTGTKGDWWIQMQGDRVLAMVNTAVGQAGIVSQKPVAPGRWFHVGFSFSNGVMKIYLNGQLQDQVNGLGSLGDAAIPITIGAGPGLPFHGTLDEVRLYDGMLSDDQVKALADEYQDGVELVGHFPLDFSADDRLGRNPGFVQGNPQRVGGRVNGALRFENGTFVAWPDRDGFIKGLSSFTISLWTQPEPIPWWQPQSYQTLFSRSNGGGSPSPGDSWILLRDGRVIAGVASQLGWGNNELSSHSLLNPFGWYHIAFTFESGTAKLYVNGSLEDQRNGLGELSDQPKGAIMLANTNGGGNLHFRGAIDEFRIYKGALSGEEIQNLFQNPQQP